MEADAALVGTDGAVHLDAVAAVDFDFAAVVEPRHPENHHAFGFGDAFQNLHLLQHGAGGDVGRQRFGHFAHGLVEFGFVGVAGDELRHECFDVTFGRGLHRGVFFVCPDSKIGGTGGFCKFFNNGARPPSRFRGCFSYRFLHAGFRPIRDDNRKCRILEESDIYQKVIDFLPFYWPVCRANRNPT